jgi:hypothetical protein
MAAIDNLAALPLIFHDEIDSTPVSPAVGPHRFVQSRRRVVSEAHMKLLQLHEYLRFLHAGTAPGCHQLSQIELDRCISAALEIWPDTGLLPWESAPRSVAYAWKSNDGRHTAAHITADRENCFLIVVLSDEHATSYIVFDIGAEYSQAEYICPSIRYHGPAQRDVILKSIPNLRYHEDPFAILEVGDGTYLQAYQNRNGTYELEHQLVTTKFHYRALGEVNMGEVCDVFISYAFGKKEWATDVAWERVEL